MTKDEFFKRLMANLRFSKSCGRGTVELGVIDTPGAETLLQSMEGDAALMTQFYSWQADHIRRSLRVYVTPDDAKNILTTCEFKDLYEGERAIQILHLGKWKTVWLGYFKDLNWVRSPTHKLTAPEYAPLARYGASYTDDSFYVIDSYSDG